MIHIGTSGYSYADWVGPVYPTGTPKANYLSFYKDLFSACELNFSYYTVPTASTMSGIVRKSEGRVIFTVKAHQEMTHERKEFKPVTQAFLEGIRPLEEARVLGCVLLQFPFSFHHGPKQREFIAALAELMPHVPLVVEFRSHDWIREETFEWLREQKLGFCCVDEPRLRGLLPPTVQVTSSIGYVRFHGRNAEKWFEHEQAWERYNYLYSESELSEWVPRIRQMEEQADEVFVFTNNHYQGKAVVNAQGLRELLA